MDSLMSGTRYGFRGDYRVLYKGQRGYTMTMTQFEINEAIKVAFFNLSTLNEMVYDYWLSELYTFEDGDYGDMIAERWNEQTFYEMEKDVMEQSLICEG